MTSIDTSLWGSAFSLLEKRPTFLQWYYHNAVIWNPTGVTTVIQLWCVYYNCKHTLTATLPGTPFPLQHCRSASWHRFNKVLAPFLVVHTDMIVSYACCRFEVSCYITSWRCCVGSTLWTFDYSRIRFKNPVSDHESFLTRHSLQLEDGYMEEIHQRR